MVRIHRISYMSVESPICQLLNSVKRFGRHPVFVRTRQLKVEGGKGFFRDPWKALFISCELWNGKLFPRETWFGYRAVNRESPFFSRELPNDCLFLSWNETVNHDSLFHAKNSLVSVLKNKTTSGKETTRLNQNYVWTSADRAGRQVTLLILPFLLVFLGIIAEGCLDGRKVLPQIIVLFSL